MSEVQKDGAAWPGVPFFDTVEYVASVGISPGIIRATTSIPVTDTVAVYGDFVLSDGQRTVVVGDCKLEDVISSEGIDGFTYTYVFLDHRWRWRYGDISGVYNERDVHDNLVPGSVKSPEELMILCLEKMGEKRYSIDAPKGITEEEILYDPNPPPGTKSPVSRTNPLIVWDCENPASALDRLCSRFGRVVTWDPITSRVVVAKPGEGGDLPADPLLENLHANIKTPPAPAGILIAGAPVRVQMKLKLIPVGLEWDGRILPIDLLSYAPKRQKQKGKWTYTFPVGGADNGKITAQFESIRAEGSPAFGAPAVASGFSAALAAVDLSTVATVSVTTSGDNVVITVEEITEGQGLNFSISATVNGAGKLPQIDMVRQPVSSPWDGSEPYTFNEVVATDRLSYEAARALALLSVHRWFMQADDDVSSGWSKPDLGQKIEVPEYGLVENRFQLIWTDSLVDQVVPEPRDPNVVSTTTGYVAENQDRYSGYAKDRSPVVYGAVAYECVGRHFDRQFRQDTPADRRVAVPFDMDLHKQVVKFSSPMFRYRSNGRWQTYFKAKLVLETAVIVRQVKTRAPIRFRRWLDFTKAKPTKEDPTDDGTVLTFNLSDYEINNDKVEVIKLTGMKDNAGKLRSGQDLSGYEAFIHEDVPYNVAGRYTFNPADETWSLDSIDGEPDDVSRPRADYYLAGRLLEHQARGGQTAVYAKVLGVPLDGAIQQVSIEVGNGATTTASRNCEHSIYVPQLNQRRREENMKADEHAAAQNKQEKAYVEYWRGVLDKYANRVRTGSGG